MLYIRDKAKGHGKTNQIEGHYTPGLNVVLIEDLVSTGGSSLKAAVAARDAGCNVQGVVAIFTYQFADADAKFADQNIPLVTLSDYSTLIDVALAQQKIGQEDVAMLQAWRNNPQMWAKEH